MNEYELCSSPCFMTLTAAAQQAAILATNSEAATYGLSLSAADAAMLVQKNDDQLAETERVAFGESITPKLIRAFLRSQYIAPTEYAETIAALLVLFYEVKEESNELLSDDIVIEHLFDAFEHSCHGSLELLQARDMTQLCRRVRNAAWQLAPDDAVDETQEEEAAQ